MSTKRVKPDFIEEEWTRVDGLFNLCTNTAHFDSWLPTLTTLDSIQRVFDITSNKLFYEAYFRMEAVTNSLSRIHHTPMWFKRYLKRSVDTLEIDPEARRGTHSLTHATVSQTHPSAVYQHGNFVYR